jgi:hypothetical protein
MGTMLITVVWGSLGFPPGEIGTIQSHQTLTIPKILGGEARGRKKVSPAIKWDSRTVFYFIGATLNLLDLPLDPQRPRVGRLLYKESESDSP